MSQYICKTKRKKNNHLPFSNAQLNINATGIEFGCIKEERIHDACLLNGFSGSDLYTKKNTHTQKSVNCL